MSGKVALPPIPPSLKQIASYIQRADELKAKDPVIAYWCTYYAAQLGLDLKVHEIPARDYLYTLIASLEEMKTSLKGNDAIENEAAGAAYVENFALRVFAMADNEDRRGDASRSTAKKFLAAANFLELLRVFEKNDNARVNDDKVKYAKWKASDIAKAFREGRKPAPGGAGPLPAGEDNQAMSPSLDTPFTQTLAELSPNGGSTPLPTDYAGRTPAAWPRQLPDDAPQPPSSNIRVSPAWSGSTIVGESDTPKPSALKALAADNNTYGPNYAEIMAKKSVHFSPSVVGGMSSTDGSPPPSPEVVEPRGPTPGYFQPHARPGPGPSSLGRIDPVNEPLPDSSPSGSSEGSPNIRARPMGRPRSGSSPPLPYPIQQGGTPTGADGGSRRISPPSKRLSLQQSPPPPPPPPMASVHHRRSSSASRNSPPQGGNSFPQLAGPPATRSPTSPGLVNLSPRSSNISGLPPTAPVSGSYAATGPYKPNAKTPSPPSHFATPGPAPPSNLPSAPPIQLTPSMTAKAQKHCRFAISSLEYEDVEQARKELRAALAILGDV